MMLPVRQFVDRLSTMIRLPARRRQAIADELVSHLEERVRDLELQGYSESKALKFAISELGEMKELAHCLQQANRTPYRRIAMNTLIVTGTVGALTAAGLFTIDNTVTNDQLAIGNVAPDVSWGMDNSVKQEMIEIGDQEVTLGWIVDVLAESSDLTPYVHSEITADALSQPLSVRSGTIFVDELLERASLDLYGAPHVPDAQIILLEKDNRLELGTQEGFDHRSKRLICYSIDDTLRGMVWGEDATTTVHSPQEAAANLTDLIQGLVYPELWNENGGYMASMHVASGGRMFIDAPQRVHDRLHWVMERLPSMKKAEVEERLHMQGDWLEDVHGGFGGDGGHGAAGGFGGDGGHGAAGGFGGEGGQGAAGGFGGEGGQGAAGGFGGEGGQGAAGGFGGDGGQGGAGGFGGDGGQGGANESMQPEEAADRQAQMQLMAITWAEQQELKEQLQMRVEELRRQAHEFESNLEQRKQELEAYTEERVAAIELRRTELDRYYLEKRSEIEQYMSQHEQAFRATEQELNQRKQELEQWAERLRQQEEAVQQAQVVTAE